VLTIQVLAILEIEIIEGALKLEGALKKMERALESRLRRRARGTRDPGKPEGLKKRDCEKKTGDPLG
jgi:hypothetical protein